MLLNTFQERKEDIPVMVQAFIERYSRKLGKQITSLKSIPQHVEVPPDMEAKRISSYFSAVLSY